MKIINLITIISTFITFLLLLEGCQTCKVECPSLEKNKQEFIRKNERSFIEKITLDAGEYPRETNNIEKVLEHSLLQETLKDSTYETPITSCSPPSSHFYEDPKGSLENTPRGKLFRCELLGHRDKKSLNDDFLFKTSGGQAEYGTRIYRIAYSTRTKDNKAQLTTALVYVPIDTKGNCLTDRTVISVNHGTTGVAQFCAPSHAPRNSIEYMILPLVARGYLVIAPDYIGLGISSKIGHPYLIPKPTTNAILDGLTALVALSKLSEIKNCVSHRAFLLGHSQGGHASLVASSSFSSILPNWKHLGTVAYAPAFGDVYLVKSPLSIIQNNRWHSLFTDVFVLCVSLLYWNVWR